MYENLCNKYEHFEKSWKIMKSGSQKTEFQGEFGARHEKNLKKIQEKWKIFPEPARNRNRTEPNRFGHKPNRTEPNRCLTAILTNKKIQFQLFFIFFNFFDFFLDLSRAAPRIRLEILFSEN